MVYLNMTYILTTHYFHDLNLNEQEMDARQTLLFKQGCKLISLIVLMLCSRQNLSIIKGNTSSIMQNSVMVIVHCTFPHRDLSTNEV